MLYRTSAGSRLRFETSGKSNLAAGGKVFRLHVEKRLQEA